MQQPLLLAAHTRYAGKQRCAVAGRDDDVEGVAAAGRAVRHGDRDAGIAPGIEVVGRPGQPAGGGVKCCAGGQAGGAVAQHIAVGIGGGQVELQRRTLGNGFFAHRQQHRRAVAGAHHHGNAAGIAAAGAVGHRDRQAHAAQVVGRGCPAEGGCAVDHARAQRGAGWQAGGAEGQGILVEIAGAHGKYQRPAHHRYLGADGRQQRWLGR